MLDAILVGGEVHFMVLVDEAQSVQRASLPLETRDVSPVTVVQRIVTTRLETALVFISLTTRQHEEDSTSALDVTHIQTLVRRINTYQCHCKINTKSLLRGWWAHFNAEAIDVFHVKQYPTVAVSAMTMTSYSIARHCDFMLLTNTQSHGSVDFGLSSSAL